MKTRRLPPYNLTKKEKDFADQLIETGSPREAALRAYDCSSKESASEIAYRNSKNEKIQSYIDAMLQLDDTVGQSVRALNDALKANIVHQGEQTDIPNHTVRLKASKQTHQLVVPKESGPRNVHLENHEHHTHFSFGDDVPKVVLEWIVENKGRWPTEPEFKRLTDGKSI
jgi:hypothetical protein